MAGLGGKLYIYNPDGSNLYYQDNDYGFSSSTTLGGMLTVCAPSVKNVSLTIGGEALSNSLNMMEVYDMSTQQGIVTLYEVTPEPETITGFFLDGQEYVLGGSGGGEWGTITGTLSDQTDLQTALNAKANSTDVLTKTNTTSYTPSADYNPATKKYVDDLVGDVETLLAAL